jgi:hypothetical protein
MRLQAVDARRFLKIANMGVFPIVPVITTRAFHWPLASGGPVKMITDIVTLILGSPALRRRPAAGRPAAAPATRAAAARRLPVSILLLATIVKPSA